MDEASRQELSLRETLVLLCEREIARLDKWAKANRCTRSEAIRVLIERGIE